MKRIFRAHNCDAIKWGEKALDCYVASRGKYLGVWLTKPYSMTLLKQAGSDCLEYTRPEMIGFTGVAILQSCASLADMDVFLYLAAVRC